MISITTNKLRFSYRNKVILEDISLEVPKGSIYGYLGKNGSGKTTTIKLILGLLDSQPQVVYYNNLDFFEHRLPILQKTGCLIESPCCYDSLSAYENLKYLDYIYKCGESRISDVLDIVALSNEREKKVKYFSTGMKQRLGIAMSIFHNPDVLILDEPLNGMDPEGIHDIRELLIRLNNEGKTIFMSSHILGELDKLCTHIGILDKGRLIFQGTKEALFTNVKKTISLKLDNPEKAKLLCCDHDLNVSHCSGEEIRIEIHNEDELNKLIHIFVDNGLNIYHIDSLDNDLESMFLHLISNNNE